MNRRGFLKLISFLPFIGLYSQAKENTVEYTEIPNYTSDVRSNTDKYEYMFHSGVAETIIVLNEPLSKSDMEWLNADPTMIHRIMER